MKTFFPTLIVAMMIAALFLTLPQAQAAFTFYTGLARIGLPLVY